MELTCGNLYSMYSDSVGDLFDTGEREAIFREACRVLLGMQPHELRMNADQKLASARAERWEAFISELKTGKPLQYILGETEFYGLAIRVNSETLIPRPETEELAALILERKTEKGLKVLDIGTGSGCIALALKSNRPGWDVTGIDVSPGAVKTARKNAESLMLEVDFKVAEIEKYRANTRYDLIVSNPPYVGTDERESLEAHVYEHEPHVALFAPEGDPLYFYRVIAERCDSLLKNGGELYLETHRDFADETVRVLTEKNLRDVEVIADLTGNNRFVTGKKD